MGNEVYFFTYLLNLYSVFVIYNFQESLDELNEHLKEPVSINRFRPKYWFFNIFWFTPVIVLFHTFIKFDIYLDQEGAELI